MPAQADQCIEGPSIGNVQVVVIDILMPLGPRTSWPGQLGHPPRYLGGDVGAVLEHIAPIEVEGPRPPWRRCPRCHDPDWKLHPGGKIPVSDRLGDPEPPMDAPGGGDDHGPGRKRFVLPLKNCQLFITAGAVLCVDVDGLEPTHLWPQPHADDLTLFGADLDEHGDQVGVVDRPTLESVFSQGALVDVVAHPGEGDGNCGDAHPGPGPGELEGHLGRHGSGLREDSALPRPGGHRRSCGSTSSRSSSSPTV